MVSLPVPDGTCASCVGGWCAERICSLHELSGKGLKSTVLCTGRDPSNSACPDRHPTHGLQIIIS